MRKIKELKQNIATQAKTAIVEYCEAVNNRRMGMYYTDEAITELEKKWDRLHGICELFHIAY